MQGRLRDAIQTYEQSLKLVKEQDEPVIQGTADLYLGLSELYRERGDLQTANQYLQQSEQLGEQAGLPNWPYRFRLAQARLKQTQGELDNALATLQQALTLAEPEGYMRIFIDEGRVIFDLLTTAETNGITPDYSLTLHKILREKAFRAVYKGQTEFSSRTSHVTHGEFQKKRVLAFRCCYKCSKAVFRQFFMQR